jgi:CBS-domain-containing membrane protein
MRDSPVHRDAFFLEVLEKTRVSEVMTIERVWASFELDTAASQMARSAGDTPWQDVFPVLDPEGRLVGMVTADALRTLAAVPEESRGRRARDVMRSAVTVTPEDDLRAAAELLVSNAIRELLVVDPEGRIIGFLDEARIADLQLRAAARGAESRPTLPPSP